MHTHSFIHACILSLHRHSTDLDITFIRPACLSCFPSHQTFPSVFRVERHSLTIFLKITEPNNRVITHFFSFGKTPIRMFVV